MGSSDLLYVIVPLSLICINSMAFDGIMKRYALLLEADRIY